MSAASVYTLSVPARAESLAAVRAFFDAILRPACGDATDPLILAIDEACSNVIRHRAAAIATGAVDIRAELSDSLVRFRLSSFCAQADLPKIKPRDITDPTPGGLGTFFISKIMDRVAYEPEPGRAECLALVMEKAIVPVAGGIVPPETRKENEEA